MLGIIICPMLAIAICLLLQKQTIEKSIVLVSLSIVSFIFSVILFISICVIGNPSQVITLSKTIPIVLSVDKFSAFFLLIINALWTPSIIYATAYLKVSQPDRNHSYFQLLSSISFLFAVLFGMSRGLVTSYIFYDVLTLLHIPLIGYNKDENSKNAATSFVILMVLLSFSLLLPGIIYIRSIYGTTLFTPNGFMEAAKLSKLSVTILFTLLVLSSGKVALFPFHTWVVKTTAAPVPVINSLQAFVATNVGIFLVFRIINDVFGLEFLRENLLFNPLLIPAIITIVIASIFAIAKRNIQTTLAYSTISSIACILLSFSLLTPLGLKAGLFQMLTHAVLKMTLILSAGGFFLFSKSSDFENLRGIALPKNTRTLGICFAISCLSLSGIPFTLGFLGKVYLLYAAIESKSITIISTIVFETILSFSYFIPIILIIFKKRHRKKGETITQELPAKKALLYLKGINFIVAFLVVLNISIFVITSIFGLKKLLLL